MPPARALDSSISTAPRSNSAASLASDPALRALSDRLPAIVWTAAYDGSITFVSEQWSRYSGDVGGAPMVAVHPDERERCVARWLQAVRAPAPYESEARFRRHDGEYRWFLSRAVPVTDDAGQGVWWLGIMTDIHEQKFAETMLRRNEERLLLATDAMASFVYDADLRTNRVVCCNGPNGAFGFSLEEMAPDMGWWQSRLHPDDLPRVTQTWKALLESGAASYAIEYRFRHRDGHYVDVLDRGRLLRDASGRAVRAVGGSMDISEHRRLEREREQLVAGAEDATRLRDDVLAAVAHDLRDPLGTIAICAQALLAQENRTKERVDEIAGLLQRATDWMNRLIRDLSDVSSIEAGRLALYLSNISPTVVLAEAVHLNAVPARVAGVALELETEQGLPAVQADHVRLLQTLGNLVTNALKFTDPGGRITLRAERDPSGVRFTVEDTGAGIAAEFLPHVFDRFWNRPPGGGVRGTGLGLAIVRGIVEAHGGHVSVESTPGKGARFNFTIPASAPSAPPASD